MKDTKSWILDAAAILFTQNGFTKTTTKAIAELAGVSESTFLYGIAALNDSLLSLQKELSDYLEKQTNLCKVSSYSEPER